MYRLLRILHRVVRFGLGEATAAAAEKGVKKDLLLRKLLTSEMPPHAGEVASSSWRRTQEKWPPPQPAWVKREQRGEK